MTITKGLTRTIFGFVTYTQNARGVDIRDVIKSLEDLYRDSLKLANSLRSLSKELNIVSSDGLKIAFEDELVEGLKTVLIDKGYDVTEIGCEDIGDKCYHAVKGDIVLVINFMIDLYNYVDPVSIILTVYRKTVEEVKE